MSYWDGKKVVVTGGAGFVGSRTVEEILRKAPTAKVTVVDDLSRGRRDNLKAVLDRIRVVETGLFDLGGCLKACEGQDVVLNLVARVAGVGFNAAHHGTMFRDNMLLGLNMLEAARRCGVERFLVVSSACVYPQVCAMPTPESEGFRDAPADTNLGYGWAKRMAEFQAQAYMKEFGMKVAIARPYNAYGPRDHFGQDDSHVIAALIRRVVEGEDPVRVWGDGTQTRAFLHVDDFARGLLEVAERYAVGDPVNLGTDEEVTIRRLAEMILEAAGSKAKLVFDPSKPAGQPRRNCDTSKAREKIGFAAKVTLADGLKRTVDWYRARRALEAAG